MSETVTVQITQGPLPDTSITVPDGVGAALVFDGRVRPDEAGQPIAGLNYEAYRPMADTQLQQLADAMLSAHGLLGLHVQHSVGHVPNGHVSFRLTVHSAHRKEGLAALDAFIDRMKRDVALWKTPVFLESNATETNRGG